MKSIQFFPLILWYFIFGIKRVWSSCPQLGGSWHFSGFPRGRIKSETIFPIDYLVFYVLDQNFDFLGKMDRFWANILYVRQFFWAESLQKTCFYVHVAARTTKSPIQRNHWVPLGCRGHLGSVNLFTPISSSVCFSRNSIEILVYSRFFLVFMSEDNWCDFFVNWIRFRNDCAFFLNWVALKFHQLKTWHIDDWMQ